MNAFGPDHWNDRFRPEEPAYGRDPSLFLVEHGVAIGRGASVLVPADGEGRNGLWLARRGARVTCVDFAEVGLAKVQAVADGEGLSLTTICADLKEWDWPVGVYDAVVAVYFHLETDVRARLHGKMVEALRPGGVMMLEAFHRDQFGLGSGGPRDPGMMFTEEMLRADFSGLERLAVRRDEVVLEEGRLHRGPAVLIRMIGFRRG
ncbi:MAG TPA: class I SAM-dependent methyltransferase [Kiritimatiellia bacterium]|nr:class I SAM-dependent methyltransferase [Kiritimatiellia bacterium]